MTWWPSLSALGGFGITTSLAVLIAASLASARRWRPAMGWCSLYAAALLLAAGSQMAFIGWGVGVQSLSFTGFSGHATRAAVVFPVALFVLLEKKGKCWQWAGTFAGALVAAGVATARVEVNAHTLSEAISGCLLGLGTGALFITRAGAVRINSPEPLLMGILAFALLLPRGVSIDPHQWLIAGALTLSGQDRVFLRQGWQRAQAPYAPPCLSGRVRFHYLCI